MYVQEGSSVHGLCLQSLPLAMSTSSATSRRVLRNLDHLWQGTNQKFINKLRPSFAQSTPAYVPPKDRITFWNIVPGDVVKLRSGAIGHDENGRPIRGEGIVTSIDRTTNRLLLRDIDDNHKMAPKNVKHVVPRLIDPEAGEEKGFSGNTTSVPRPVHYSKVMLKVPDTQTYASRIVRSKPFYDRQKGMFVWKRFAIVKATDEESLRTGGALKKIYVPWPKVPERCRPFRTTHADGRVAEEETWVPWVPEDPVLLPMQKPRTTPAREAIAAERRAVWNEKIDRLRAQARDSTFATPPGAKSYAGFAKTVNVRPPPIAQPPSVSELVKMERQRLVEFVHNPETQSHVEQGGQLFAAHDYLDVAPLVGPAAGGEWGALEEASSGSVRDEQGRLVARPSKADVHSMPIELLMGKDLANETGLKWRMRHWKTKQAERQAQEEALRAEEKELLKELDALRV